jgi:branched-chain amino acid aminotransferase
VNPPANILPIAYLNGAYRPVAEAVVSPLDRGFLMGDGLFETLHVVRGAPIDLEPHLARLDESCEFFGISVPRRAELPEIFARVIEKNALDDHDAPEAALRLTVTRGVDRDGPATVLVHMRRLDSGHLSKRDIGVHLHVLPIGGRGDPDLVRHKSSSYVASALSDVWLRGRPGYKPTDEGLFVSSDGEVREGASCNVFAIIGTRLVTPPIEAGVLPGISRSVVCSMASEVGLELEEGSLSLRELELADEAFVTSSTLHVAPIIAVGEHGIGEGVPGGQVRSIQAAFNRRVLEQVEGWWRS